MKKNHQVAYKCVTKHKVNKQKGVPTHIAFAHSPTPSSGLFLIPDIIGFCSSDLAICVRGFSSELSDLAICVWGFSSELSDLAICVRESRIDPLFSSLIAAPDISLPDVKACDCKLASFFDLVSFSGSGGADLCLGSSSQLQKKTRHEKLAIILLRKPLQNMLNRCVLGGRGAFLLESPHLTCLH